MRFSFKQIWLITSCFFLGCLPVHAQSLQVIEELQIPDSLTLGSYFQVSETGEILILADNGIFSIKNRRWVVKSSPELPILTFSLHPSTGKLDYLTRLDLFNGTYGLFKYIDLDTITQFILVKLLDTRYRKVHPIQLEDEVYLFWENASSGFGFGQIIYNDSIMTAMDLSYGKIGPFDLINRNVLSLFLDNILVIYTRNTGIRSVVVAPISPEGICSDGNNGLYLSADNGILQFDDDEKFKQVYKGKGGYIKWSNNKIYNYLPDLRLIRILRSR